MNLSRAFLYPFEDPQWAGKLALALLWGLVSFIPLLGLAGMAMLAGYGLDVVRNQLAGSRRPLPPWTDFNSRMGDGFNALVAVFVYNIPNALPLCGLLLFFSRGDSGILSLLSLCCLLLFLLLWNLFSGLMLATGATRYVRTRQLTAWFQPGELWDTLRLNSDLFLQWLFYSALANLALGLVAGLPLVGWLISLALFVPVQGHLLGQLALALEDREKDTSPGVA